MHSASAFAANTFCRSLVAAAFPLFTVQMFTAVRLLSLFSFNYLDPCLSLLTLPQLGVNWAATLLGSVGLLLAPSPFLFYKYGARIRARSTFAHCTDLKVAQIIADEKAVV
jgi:hypothetical protein